MPLLQVRDFPPDLYEEIGRLAERERRSVAQQTVVLLRGALGKPEASRARRQRILAECRARVESMAGVMLDPVALVREDRER